MQKIKAGLQISRIHGADTHEIEIRIQDEISRAVFVEMHLPIEAFAKALFGQPVAEQETELRGLSIIGKKHEVKEELVPCDPWNATDRHRSLRVSERSGWKAREGDIDNAHRFVRDKGVNVVFFRNTGKGYVEQELLEESAKSKLYR